jgi:hypothetical protein
LAAALIKVRATAPLRWDNVKVQSSVNKNKNKNEAGV